MSVIKIIWELIKNAPAVIAVINELIKLIKDIIGSDDDTKEQLQKAKEEVKKIKVVS